MDRLTPPPRRGSRVYPDVVSGSVLLFVAIGYGVIALGIPRGGGEPGPGALPLALAVLLAALSGWILVRGLRAPPSPAVSGGQERPRPSASVERGQSTRPWLAALATLGYVALFQVLGFVLGTLAYTYVLAWLFGRDPRFIVAVPVGVTTVLFVFFRLALGVRLPAGPFG